MVNIQHEIWCESDWFLLQYLSSYRCSWAFMFRQVFGFFLFGHSFQAMSFDMLFHVVSISAMINLIIWWRKYFKIYFIYWMSFEVFEKYTFGWNGACNRDTCGVYRHYGFCDDGKESLDQQVSCHKSRKLLLVCFLDLPLLQIGVKHVLH